MMNIWQVVKVKSVNSVWTLLLSDNISLKKQVLLLEEIQKLNRENVEKSDHQLKTGFLDLEAGVSPKDQQLDAAARNLVDYLREDSQVAEKHEASSEEGAGGKAAEGEAVVTEQEPKLDVEEAVKEDEEVPEEKKEEEASAAAPEIPAEKEPAAAR